MILLTHLSYFPSAAGGNAHLLNIWGDGNDSFLLALQFLYSLGALVSPVATEPFLTKKQRICESLPNATLLEGGKSVPNVLGSSLATRVTKTSTGSLEYVSTEESAHSTAINASDTANVCTDMYGYSQVHGAFWIASAIFMLSTICALLITFRENTIPGAKLDSSKENEDNKKKNKRPTTHMSRAKKVFLLFLLAMLFASYGAVENTFTNYLVTFLITYSKWNKEAASYATAVFWIFFAGGRFSGIFDARCCSSSFTLTIHLLAIVVSQVGFLVSAMMRLDVLVWVFTSISGFAMSVIFPELFSWISSDVIHVCGKLSALFLVTVRIGHSNGAAGWLSNGVRNATLDGLPEHSVCYRAYIELRFC